MCSDECEASALRCSFDLLKIHVRTWVLQHSSVRKSLLWHLTVYNGHANVGIFSLGYAVMPSFLISVLFIDPYVILNLIYWCVLKFSDEWLKVVSDSFDSDSRVFIL